MMSAKQMMAEAKVIIKERNLGNSLRLASWSATTINGKMEEVLD